MPRVVTAASLQGAPFEAIVVHDPGLTRSDRNGGDMGNADWMRSWDPAIAAIGRDFSGGVISVAADAVEAGAIRRFCEVLELACPLHHDPETARRFGYRDIIAPQSGVSTWARRAAWRPGDSTRYPTADTDVWIAGERPSDYWATLPQPAGTLSLVTGIEIEYFEPVCVGDRLTSSGRRLVSVTPRETSVGRGAFMTFQSEVRNQAGALVAKINNAGFHYDPSQNGEVAARSAVAEKPAAPRGDLNVEPVTVDWDEQRYFEDIAAGDDIPPVALNLTVARLVVEAGANLDFSPLHHNSSVARAWGAPAMFANSIFIQGWWERTVREYIGLAGRIHKLGPLRMGVFNPVGETVVTRGIVKRTWREGVDGFVELELRSETSRGVTVGPGPLTISLPRRAA